MGSALLPNDLWLQSGPMIVCHIKYKNNLLHTLPTLFWLPPLLYPQTLCSHQLQKCSPLTPHTPGHPRTHHSLHSSHPLHSGVSHPAPAVSEQGLGHEDEEQPGTVRVLGGDVRKHSQHCY